MNDYQQCNLCSQPITDNDIDTWNYTYDPETPYGSHDPPGPIYHRVCYWLIHGDLRNDYLN